MQPWVWLAAYVLGFGLLQVVLYRHFSRSPSPEPGDSRIARTDGGRRVATETADDTVACTHCGTVNEAHQMIRYCGSCAQSLR